MGGPRSTATRKARAKQPAHDRQEARQKLRRQPTTRERFEGVNPQEIAKRADPQGRTRTRQAKMPAVRRRGQAATREAATRQAATRQAATRQATTRQATTRQAAPVVSRTRRVNPATRTRRSQQQGGGHHQARQLRTRGGSLINIENLHVELNRGGYPIPRDFGRLHTHGGYGQWVRRSHNTQGFEVRRPDGVLLMDRNGFMGADGLWYSNQSAASKFYETGYMVRPMLRAGHRPHYGPHGGGSVTIIAGGDPYRHPGGDVLDVHVEIGRRQPYSRIGSVRHVDMIEYNINGETRVGKLNDLITPTGCIGDNGLSYNHEVIASGRYPSFRPAIGWAAYDAYMAGELRAGGGNVTVIHGGGPAYHPHGGAQLEIHTGPRHKQFRLDTPGVDVSYFKDRHHEGGRLRIGGFEFRAMKHD